MGAACRVALQADQQRKLEALALHLTRNVNHLVERRRDEAAEADDVGADFLGAVENLLGRNHHAHVDHVVVIAGQDDADDILTDIVYVAFDGGEDNLALRLDLLA